MIPVSSFQPWLGVSILMRFGLTLLMYMGMYSVIPVPGRIFNDCSLYALHRPQKKRHNNELYNHAMTNEGNCKLSGSTKGIMNPGALDTLPETNIAPENWPPQ